MLLVTLAPLAAAADGLVVASSGGQAPFAVLDAAGEVRGLERDLVERLCDELKHPCRFVTAPTWSDLVGGLRDGRYDIGYGGLTMVTAGSLGLPVSTPYLPLAARFAGRGELPPGIDPLGPDGPVIGVLRGSPHALWLEARLPLTRLQRYAEDEEMYLSLQAGSVDLVFGDAIGLWRGLLAGPLGAGVHFVGAPVVIGEEDGMVLAVGAGSELAPQIDAALARLGADGTLAALIARDLPGYLGP